MHNSAQFGTIWHNFDHLACKKRAKKIRQIMATLKFYLDTRHAKKDGTFPLKIKIAQKKEAKFVNLNVSLKTEQWDSMENKIINHKRKSMLNSYIKERMMEVENMVYSLMKEGKINSIHQFGISFSVTDQDNFNIEFWISTKEINELDSSYIMNTNLYIYDLLLKKLTQFLKKKYLIFCSIGSETVLSCNEIDEVDISKSKNVCMWIFPTDKNIQALERYSKNTVNEFIVYRLYE